MTSSPPPKLLTWNDLPETDAEVTLRSFEDDEGDYVAPARVDYPATASSPARAFVREGEGWVEVDPSVQ